MITVETVMIELPFPPRCLHPNDRPHWSAKAKAAAKFKQDCFYLALQVKWKVLLQLAQKADQPSDIIKLLIIWHPKTANLPDMDGCISNLKAGMDGVALAWGVNDNSFRLSWELGAPVKGGKVFIKVLE